MDTAIKVENLTKRYRLGVISTGSIMTDFQSWWARVRSKEDPNAKIGTQQRSNQSGVFMALNGVNLEVKKGEALGILGPNGAGKSTLLKILSRITAPTSGIAYLSGRVTSMLEVGTGFHPEMTGRENIYMNGAILGMTRAEIDEKVEEIVAFSEIGEFIDTPVKRYSSGMYVKLAFSVAAHLNSEIMIVDEVLSVGDVKFQMKCIDKMEEIVTDSNRTVLCVSHNIYNIKRLCRHCIVMDEGKIIFDGHVDEAISVYLGNPAFSNAGAVYEFQKNNFQWQADDRNILPQRLTVTETEVEKNNQMPLVFKLTWQAPKTKCRYKLRIMVAYVDSSLAGTSLTDFFEAQNVGESNSTVFSMDVDSLAPGNYSFRFDVLREDEALSTGLALLATSKVNIFFSVLEPAENKEAAALQKYSWNHDKWGNVQLPTTLILEEEPARP